MNTSTMFPLTVRYTDVTDYRYKTVERQTFFVPGVPDVLDHPYIRIVNQVMSIKENYMWDGASDPFYEIPFIGRKFLETDASRAGSLIHDAGYQLMRQGFLPIEYKKLFDQFLYDICVLKGMNKSRAYIYYIAVDKFGWNSCKLRKEPEQQDEVHTI